MDWLVVVVVPSASSTTSTLLVSSVLMIIGGLSIPLSFDTLSDISVTFALCMLTSQETF